jgi:UrcA family protein
MLKHYKALSLCAAVALTALSVAVVTPAQAKSQPVTVTAQRASDLPTQRVSFADLNLASASDQGILETRVGHAVKEVCGEREQLAIKTLTSFSHYVACRDFAWDGARPQLAAAIDRARAMALNGNGAVAVGSLAISISAPAGF